jgi:septal ring factor EnvC (AmiA/AmiB activator)
MANEHYKNWGGNVNTNPAALAPSVDPKPSDTETINFAERIDKHLAELKQAVSDYQNDQGQVATTLQKARLEVSRIKSELFHAEKNLAELEAKGSALQRYSSAVSQAEGQYQKTLSLYSDSVYADIIKHLFGREVPLAKLSAERRSELKLHARIDDLRQFSFVPQSDVNKRFDVVSNRIVDEIRVERTNKRVNLVGEKFIALKTHIAAEQAKQKAK